MPGSLDKALGIHSQALSLRGQRAQVLASNLANADTPNYKAKDMDFKSAMSRAQGQTIDPKRTHAGHLTAPGEAAAGTDLKYRIPLQPSLDGNTVDTHHEQSAYAENAVQYQASLQFLGGRLKSILAAIRGE
jgi:flagellar basal-body rod protein FlgB